MECLLPYGTDDTVLSATRHKWTHPASAPARQASTRFTYPWGMEGWVDLGDFLHAEMVYPPADVHPSKYKPGPVSINYVDRSQRANHYTTPQTDGAICQTFNSSWPGVHGCWTPCLEHSAGGERRRRCSLPSVNNLKPGSSENHIRTLSSEPAFLIQTINLEVALLLRQSLIDWLIDWLKGKGVLVIVVISEVQMSC